MYHVIPHNNKKKWATDIYDLDESAGNYIE